MTTLFTTTTIGMTVGQTTADEQGAADGFIHAHIVRGTTATSHTTTTTHTSTAQTIVLQRPETGRQGAIVRQWLAFATLVRAFVIRLLHQAQTQHECHHHIGIQLFPATTAQVFRQTDITKTGTNQTADRHTHGFKHATHFTVTTFMNCDAIPTVAALTAQKLDQTELGHTVFQLHAITHGLHLLFAQLAQNTYCVFTLGTVARMHHAVGNIARCREDQQTFGVQIQTTNRQPLAHFQGRQATEHGGTALRVVVRNNFASGLVVQNHARRALGIGPIDQLTINTHLVVCTDTLTNMSRLAIHGNTACNNQLFHIAARTDTGLGQHLVQFRLHQLAAHVFTQALRQTILLVQMAECDVVISIQNHNWRVISRVRIASILRAALAFASTTACILTTTSRGGFATIILWASRTGLGLTRSGRLGLFILTGSRLLRGIATTAAKRGAQLAPLAFRAGILGVGRARGVRHGGCVRLVRISHF